MRLCFVLVLLEGWKEYQDKETGKPYYHHAATNHTTWDRPARVQACIRLLIWHVSSSSYIYATNHTTWDRPAKVAQERADTELAKKLQMQLQLQVSSSSYGMHASSSSYDMHASSSSYDMNAKP